MPVSFGSLITSNKQKYNIKDILKKDSQSIEYLFQNHHKNLAKFEVIEIERKIALDNLRKLTTELQTNRLRYKAKSYCKYFTL